jgi:glycosyltransferase involved in cell wall biosynthesis
MENKPSEQNQDNSNNSDSNIHSDGYSYIFTVFTPSYNRAYSLDRVYESLQAQTFRNFEWLIVDDGSKDNTRELVESWQQVAEFPIRYVYQQNAGKNSASNAGVQLAKGELFLTLDSDDRCMPNALERLYYHWDSIPADRKHLFSAVTALCEDQYGNLQGKRFPQPVFDANPLEMSYRYGFTEELWGFQRTDIMKEFPSPTMPGQHISDGITWGRIASKYQTRFIDEILRTYYLGDMGKDQLTRQDPTKQSPGIVTTRKYTINNDIKWLRYAPLYFLKCATQYNRFGFHIHNSIQKQLGEIDSIVGKLLVAVAIPIGWFFYLLDRQKLTTGTK